MIDKNISYNNLIELQDYLRQKYNIKVYVNKSKNLNIIKKIEDVYIKLFFLIVFIIIIIFSYFIFKTNINKIRKNNLFSNIVFYVLLISIIVYILFLLQKYIFMIYFYYKNNNLYEDSSVNYNNINFNSGDILQEVSNWNYNYGFLLYFFPLDFLHNLFVIKFKNKDYILHYTNGNNGYPENILSFNDTNYVEIFLLNDYLIDNYHATKYYRLFKTKKIVDNDKIFTFLKSLKMCDLKFSFLPCIKENNISNNYYNCMSFLLKLLNNLSILKDFNIHNFTSNDLIYLPEISNNMYDKPILLKI
jgi:hypothetical protein